MNRPQWIRPDPSEPDSCETLDPLLSLHADGLATGDEARRVEAHLPLCASCRRTLLWIQATHRALASRPIVLPPPDLRARIARSLADLDAAPLPLRPARVFTLRPAYAAAASLSLAALLIGYGLHQHPVSPVAPLPSPPPVSVAAKPPVVSPAPGTAQTVRPVRRPRVTAPPLVAQNKPSRQPEKVATALPDDTAQASSPASSPAPSASARKPVLNPEASQASVHPLRSPVPHKKPVQPRSNQGLMANAHVPLPPVTDRVPKVIAPIAPKSVEIAKLPDTPPVTHPDAVVPDRHPEESPKVADASSNGAGHFQTADFMVALHTYTATHQTSVEHNLTLAGRTAVHTAVHTTANLLGTSDKPIGPIMVGGSF